MKIIIIDDEQKSIENLKSLLHNYCPIVNEIAEANNILEAEVLIRRSLPDLIFLDIEMPNGNGFDLLNNIKDLSILVIFITAFDHYAVEAFRQNAIDYLLKPIDVDQLLEAVQKANTYKKNATNSTHEIIQKFPQLFNSNKIKLPTMNGFELLDVDQIIFVKSNGNYTHVFSKQNKKYIISKNIGEIEKILPNNLFIRIHNEHVVNINEIVRYVKGRGGYIILKNNQHLDVAERRKKILLDILEI